MKKLLLIVICIITLSLLGCSKNTHPPLPTLQLTYNDQQIPITQGGYHWTYQTGLLTSKSVVADAASPSQIALKMGGTMITPSANISLNFSTIPTDVKIYSWVAESSTLYSTSTDSFGLPSEEGTYIFEIIGTWPEGSVSYTTKLIVNP